MSLVRYGESRVDTRSAQGVECTVCGQRGPIYHRDWARDHVCPGTPTDRAARRSARLNQLAAFGTYCPTCGLANMRWPGCDDDFHDDRGHW